jgi:hypothetical protein
MATNFLARLKSRPRFALAILLVGACAYAIDRWFFSGVMASKWIGLSEYEQAMKELQRQSLIWGDVAVVLGIVGFVLILPPWPVRSKIESNFRRKHLVGIFRSMCFSRRNHPLRDIWSGCHDSLRRNFPSQISQRLVSRVSLTRPAVVKRFLHLFLPL